MTSMRKLNRRLFRWRRYVDRHSGASWKYRPPRGYDRALKAVRAEEERRFWDETPEIWLGGPDGEAALIADVLDDRPRCTLTAPTEPSTCYCTSRPGCPYEGGDDPCACGHVLCTGDCDEADDGDGDGDGDGWPPIRDEGYRPVETTGAFQKAGLL